MEETEQSGPNFVYYPQEEVEHLERYCAGQYHPVKLGDEYSDGRYCVVHKLGYGSYSTVWLAKDRHSNKYVALKIIIADDSASSSEDRILRLLEKHRMSNPGVHGEEYVSKILNEFSIDGPNGRHTCLVSEPAGGSAAESKEAGLRWRFPLHRARGIAARVILGLNFVHSAGVVHGDLYTGNILFKVPSIDGLSTKELYQQFAPLTKQPVKRRDGGPLDAAAPPYAVVPLWMGEACEDVTIAEVMIADFGEAYVAKEKVPHTLNTPILYCPPEMLLKTGAIGMPADIWALACTIFEIMGTSSLFESFLPTPDQVISEMVDALGKPSEESWKAWANRYEFFHEDGTWVPSPRGYQHSSRPLDMRISQMRREADDNFTKAEQDALLQLMSGMLTYDPQERFTIADVIDSEWMEKFGKPAILDQSTGLEKGAASQPEQSQAGAGEYSTNTNESPSSSTAEFIENLDEKCPAKGFLLQASDMSQERS
ncbi:MAG: hypothetical protein Q9207_007690 [Kuettlingeria erythrocarpa]